MIESTPHPKVSWCNRVFFPLHFKTKQSCALFIIWIEYLFWFTRPQDSIHSKKAPANTSVNTSSVCCCKGAVLDVACGMQEKYFSNSAFLIPTSGVLLDCESHWWVSAVGASRETLIPWNHSRPGSADTQAPEESLTPSSHGAIQQVVQLGQIAKSSLTLTVFDF